MQVQLLFFGVLSDVTGKREELFTFTNELSVKILKEKLAVKYPKFKTFANYTIAINMEYANNNSIVKNNDVVALIPPVSGG